MDEFQQAVSINPGDLAWLGSGEDSQRKHSYQVNTKPAEVSFGANIICVCHYTIVSFPLYSYYVFVRS